MYIMLWMNNRSVVKWYIHILRFYYWVAIKWYCTKIVAYRNFKQYNINTIIILPTNIFTNNVFYTNVVTNRYSVRLMRCTKVLWLCFRNMVLRKFWMIKGFVPIWTSSVDHRNSLWEYTCEPEKEHEKCMIEHSIIFAN